MHVFLYEQTDQQEAIRPLFMERARGESFRYLAAAGNMLQSFG
jgi:hypothetical protein